MGKSITEGECESRNEMYNIENCEENGKYFLYLSMEDQIKDILQNEDHGFTIEDALKTMDLLFSMTSNQGKFLQWFYLLIHQQEPL